MYTGINNRPVTVQGERYGKQESAGEQRQQTGGGRGDGSQKSRGCDGRCGWMTEGQRPIVSADRLFSLIDAPGWG